MNFAEKALDAGRCEPFAGTRNPIPWEVGLVSETASSPFFGVSRREFIGYCGWAAAVLGLGGGGTKAVAKALGQLAERPVVVYASFQACTGCAIQLLQAREPTVQDLILRQISLEYQDNVMAAAGTGAEAQWKASVSKEGYYLVCEGSIPQTIPGALTSGGRTGQEILREAVPNAAGIIAFGSCAAFGNIQASYPNPTGAVGIAEFLQADMGADAPPVINLPRCPGHGDDLILTLANILVTGKLPELDALGRPVSLYGQTIHDTCFRRGEYEAGNFAENFGDPNIGQGWCLYKLGCKGPYTWAPCGVNLWNGNVSWCVHNNPCQGCSEPDFWDNYTPFYEQYRGVDQDGWSVPFEGIGLAAAGVTAVGMGAFAFAHNRRDQKPRLPDPEQEPTQGGEE
jgi:hydrogenase small subunit